MMHSRAHADLQFRLYVCNKGGGGGGVSIVSNSFIAQLSNGPPHKFLQLLKNLQQ